ncbi:hypothetical protein HYPSUDRAFT_147951 [Hypholoma sublateritium FD-334 SS-4]|uniref:DUF202 domain-containing protein n=1 Tax=Hypholoma sublateritium (strain FD-334 SS-4) TaxID=945553 RepID=A0A0D2P7C5_HYPSF|nr:hypothetical protein HYPSUDRAFT_147951 [Hypholoma sublateritium FD-334 SS-4]
MVNPQLVLENCGSVARDHLASERTFLAYVRTSLALASAGVALVQLFTIADLTSISDSNRQIQRFARPLGVAMVLFALIMLGIGVYRYFLVQNSLPKQKFPPARLSVALISFILGGITIVLFGALLSAKT